VYEPLLRSGDARDLNDELVRRAREQDVAFAIDTDADAVPHLATFVTASPSPSVAGCLPWT